MDTTLADPLVGRLLDGRYQVEALVARGGMATVYLATDTRLERRVALKVMHADLARDEGFVNRFIGEAKAVARLSHPNVVAVFDQGSDGQYLYLAMEYLPGMTLRGLLDERGWFAPHEALGIMVPLLSGLAAAHAAGIVHRDVKPENVLIGPDGRLKVVDFGLARGLAVSNQTRTGMIIGTVAYLAPEQVSGTGADTRTDVYAAGIVLFELLTGVQPHTGDSPLAVAYKHVNEAVPAPSTVAQGIPPEVDRLVAMATSRDPRDRPADAGELLRAAGNVRRGMPAGAQAGVAPQVDIPHASALLADGRPAVGQEHSTQAFAAPGGTDGRTLIAPHEELGGFYGPAGGTDHYGTGYDSYAHDGGYSGAGYRGRRRRRTGFLVALALIIIAAAGAGGWWFTQGRYATVPAVTGMADGTAVTMLRADGFTVRIAAPQPDNHAKQGMVVRTIPAAGGRAPQGSAVTLIPSAGPRMIKVPAVAGQRLASAQAALRSAGLTPSGQVRRVISSAAAAGVVISTQPAAGTPWPQPKPVVITVSEGPPLPTFIGQDEHTIEQWAAQNGITLNVTHDSSSSQPQGIITQQSPAPGTPVTANETVTVGVSSGPPQVAIPDVRGMNVAQAQQTLQQAGFTVTVDRFGPFDKVFDYNPNGQALKGSTITIYVGF
ncbi:MAG TPA: Stk1 family PASTA domain-containing Ser/Thr kinase [Streptosporangiaceae bacterium]|nr:Stk1 family PASTA domain-containing Ser/Thr kinase [Streptosporangiaceae bacterium]